jgi:hypothetical protein
VKGVAGKAVKRRRESAVDELPNEGPGSDLVGAGLPNEARRRQGGRHRGEEVWAAAHLRGPSTAGCRAAAEVLVERKNGFNVMSTRTMNRRTRPERDFYAERLTSLEGVPRICGCSESEARTERAGPARLRLDVGRDVVDEDRRTST